jgi:hypothetical protein
VRQDQWVVTLFAPHSCMAGAAALAASAAATGAAAAPAAVPGFAFASCAAAGADVTSELAFLETEEAMPEGTYAAPQALAQAAAVMEVSPAADDNEDGSCESALGEGSSDAGCANSHDRLGGSEARLPLQPTADAPSLHTGSAAADARSLHTGSAAADAPSMHTGSAVAGALLLHTGSAAAGATLLHAGAIFGSAKEFKQAVSKSASRPRPSSIRASFNRAAAPTFAVRLSRPSKEKGPPRPKRAMALRTGSGGGMSALARAVLWRRRGRRPERSSRPQRWER